MARFTEALANPKVLIWARRMAGLQLDDAARKVPTPLNRLESWEKGERRPTIRQLRKLADIYKRPLAVFFLAEPPPDESIPSDFRRFDPDAAEPLSPRLRLAIRDARARREATLELSDELDESMPQFSLKATLADDPEEVGKRLRDALTSEASPPTGDPRLALNFWRAAAESSGILVFQAEGVDVEEMRGFSISERPLPTVVLNIKDAAAARSFSLLHEITHVALNVGGLCVFEESGPRSDVQRTEVFCNHAAGAVLLPAESLLRDPETPKHGMADIPDARVASLAKRYGASPEVVLRRLVILNRVSRSYYRHKREQFAKQYEELRRQRRQAGGFPSRATLAIARGGQFFTRLVIEAYDEERITASDVADLLGERLKHLEKIRSAISRMATVHGEPS